MNLFRGGGGGVEHGQEPLEGHRVVGPDQLGDHLAGLDVEGRVPLICSVIRRCDQVDSGPGDADVAITTAWTRTSKPCRRGRPDRFASVSVARPPTANRDRHLRTVSTLTCRSAAIWAFGAPAAAARTIFAAQ